MKGLRITKLQNKLNLKGYGRVRSKKLFLEKIIHKIFETNCSFHAK